RLWPPGVRLGAPAELEPASQGAREHGCSSLLGGTVLLSRRSNAQRARGWLEGTGQRAHNKRARRRAAHRQAPRGEPVTNRIKWAAICRGGKEKTWLRGLIFSFRR